MNPGQKPSPEARALPEMHLATLATNLNLDKFAKKKDRRRVYSRLLEEAGGSLADATESTLSDRDLRDLVVLALRKDRTFIAFVINEGGSEQAATESGSSDVIQAGAGAILCDYLEENNL